MNEVPIINFTTAAITHVLGQLAKQTQVKGIRISVKKTGCSGLSYVVDYVDEAFPHDLSCTPAEGMVVFIDTASYPYLKGMQIDYVKEGLNAKLVFENPNQKGQCGCGESFTV